MKTQRKYSDTASLGWQLDDIYLDIVWSKIAKQCFPDKSMGWFFNKIHGNDGNGGIGHFTIEEKEDIRNALFDLSERIRNAAHSITVPVEFEAQYT